MKIAMFTNTYLPHVGGVARSVKTLEDQCRALGHEVLIVAPEYEGAGTGMFEGVLRVPAICNFNGSDFSFQLPFSSMIHDVLDAFAPDVIHSHHPFLLGDAALREASRQRVPIVFTHHTLYERYTHYVPMDSTALKRMAVQLATEYCNLCDLVIAPSESVRRLLRDRGVTTMVDVSPTGVDTKAFAAGDGEGFRNARGIPAEARVIGHVGRLAKEKNLLFLTDAVKMRLKEDPQSIYLLVGEGDALDAIKASVAEDGLSEQLVAVGRLSGQELIDSYNAMDLFVFASQTETQGMVLAEAMAAGLPVVAIDGPGVREIMRDGVNGVLLDGDSEAETFSRAISELLDDRFFMQSCKRGAYESAMEYDQVRNASYVVELYQELSEGFLHEEGDRSGWERVLNSVKTEWDLIGAKMSAAAAAVIETPATEVDLD